MIRVVLPYHLRRLANIEGEVQLEEVAEPVSIATVLDSLEARYPMLRGTIRDHITGKRRAFLRYYACEQDWSLEDNNLPLPKDVAEGKQPFLVVGAIAGG